MMLDFSGGRKKNKKHNVLIYSPPQLKMISKYCLGENLRPYASKWAVNCPTLELTNK